MKKVLYVATVYSHVCQFHLPYLKSFKEQGCETWVAGRDNLAEKNGLSLKHVDNAVNISFRRFPFNPKNIKAYKQLKTLINKENFDIIVCNTPVGGILTRMASKKARKNGTNVIYIAHGFHFYKGAPKKNWILYYPLEKHFAKKCDYLVTITNEDYELASKKFKTKVVRMHGVGVDGDRHYPISEEQKLSLRKELGVSDKDFICLCTGELNKNKNQKFLIDLVPKLKEQIPNIKLWLAGNGASKEDLELQIEKLGVKDSVTLLGYQPKIENYVRASDVVLTASKREGLPFNVVEAMLTKRPVVASVNRGHRELIKDGETGFITNEKDKYFENIVSLFEDKNLYQNIAKNAYDYAQSYTIKSTINEFEEFIDEKYE